MAPRIRSNKLENRTVRRSLPKGRLHRQKLAPCIHIAYRPADTASGSWSIINKHPPEWMQRIATADDFEEANGETVMNYEQACLRVLDLARVGEGNSGAMDTVYQALDTYEEALVAAGLSKYNATTLKKRHLPKTLANKPVGLLKSRDLTGWLTFMLAQGLKSSSIERSAKSLVAALNLAADEDSRITNRKIWKGLAAAAAALSDDDDDTEMIRDNFILPDHTITAIVHACHQDSVEPGDHFGMVIEVMADTGSRASQVFRLKPKHLLDDDPAAASLSMSTSRKGSNRKKRRKTEYNPIPISPRLAAILRQRADACTADQPLFEKVGDIGDRLRAVVERLGLDPDLTAYCLRYSSIARQLTQGTNATLVAKNHDTSVAVIEAFYARHIAKTKQSDAATRATLIDHGTGPMSNVVAIAGRR
jgi:integrase